MANSAVVGTLRALFVGDTSDFQSATKKAADSAAQMASDMDKASKSFEAAGGRMASVTRLVKDFSGSLERRSAEEFAAAIEKIGGAARLSEGELRRSQSVFSDYISKAKALGQDIPPHIAKLAGEIDKLNPPTARAGQSLGVLQGQWTKLVAAFSAANLIDRAIRGIIDFGTEAVQSASHITDLANKTGLSTDAIQRFEHVAKQTGTTVDAFAQATFKLGANIAGATSKDKVGKALETMGFQIAEIQRLKPEEQFDRIATALSEMENPQERNRLALDLFGKSVGDVIPAIVENYKKLAEGATIASEASIRALDAASDAWDEFLSNTKQKTVEFLGSTILALQSQGGLAEVIKTLLSGGDVGQTIMIQSLLEAERKRHEQRGKDVDLTEEQIETEEDYVAALRQAEIQIANLTKADREQIDAALKIGKTWDDLPEKLRLNTAAQKLYTSAVKEGTKQIKESDQEYQKWKDTVTGASLQRQVDTLTERLRRLMREGGLTAEAFKAITREAIDLESKGAKLSPTLELATHRFVDFTKQGKSLFETWAKVGDTVENVTVGFVEFNEVGESVFETWGPLAKVTENFQVGLEDLGDETSHFRETAANAFMKVGSEFVRMGGAIGGEAGQIAATIGGLAEGIGRLASGDILGGIAQLTSLLTRFKTLTRNVARDMQDAFATTELGFEHLGALNQHLRDLGAIDLVNAGDRAQRKDDENATRKWMEDVRQFLDDVERKSAAAFSALTKAAADFGGKAPAALQPFIQELLRANALTDEQRDLLNGLAGAPEWQELQSIAQKYGIELSALGQHFQDARLGDMAMQYARDFMTLRDAGGDVNGLLQGMQDEVQALVNDARKFGTAMPEAMRPVIEGLISMGLLTDENGNKFEDLASTGLSFTGTLEDAFKDMKTILEQIRDLLAGALPQAAKRGGQQVSDELTGAADKIADRFSRMHFEIPVRFDTSDFSPPQGFATSDIPSAQHGGKTTAEGLVWLHPNEMIIPLDQTGDSFDPTRVVTVDNRLYLDGREVTVKVVQHMREIARREGVRPI